MVLLRRILLVLSLASAWVAPRRPSIRGVALRAEPEEPSVGVKGAWFAAEVFGKAAAALGATKGLPVKDASGGPPRSVDEAVRRLAADYDGADGPYFLTGVMDAAVYDDDCEFADPFVSFRGRARFEENLANLAGGFITDASIRTLATETTEASYKTKLLVKLRLALPWKPVLAWPWGVEHVLEERPDGTVVVVRHLESWDVSAAEGVRQLFRSGPKGPLGPQKKKSDAAAPSPQKNALGTKDPIAGPLVAAARAVGALPQEEEDGWTGEPSAWADEESFTQKLSGFTQKYAAGFKQVVAEAVAGDFDADAVDADLNAALARGGVTMYSFTSCPFCKKAKELLDDKGAKYTVYELDERPDGAALRARIGARTGRTSVPAIWVGADYIGGLNDGAPGLLPLDKVGDLDGRLRAAGALP